jgi:hypothetical protein
MLKIKKFVTITNSYIDIDISITILKSDFYLKSK